MLHLFKIYIYTYYNFFKTIFKFKNSQKYILPFLLNHFFCMKLALLVVVVSNLCSMHYFDETPKYFWYMLLDRHYKYFYKPYQCRHLVHVKRVQILSNVSRVLKLFLGEPFGLHQEVLILKYTNWLNFVKFRESKCLSSGFASLLYMDLNPDEKRLHSWNFNFQHLIRLNLVE